MFGAEAVSSLLVASAVGSAETGKELELQLRVHRSQFRVYLFQLRVVFQELAVASCLSTVTRVVVHTEILLHYFLGVKAVSLQRCCKNETVFIAQPTPTCMR